ncbi:MAG: hypothetical protein DRP42_04785 [Tenericutes bacterium]|nr:MAG: hypothetical protein DRP42_04785 [Mycoplasmatota bacterium]
MKLIPPGQTPMLATADVIRFAPEFAEMQIEDRERPFKVQLDGRYGRYGKVYYKPITEAVLACSLQNPVMYIVGLADARQTERWETAEKVTVTYGEDRDKVTKVWSTVKPKKAVVMRNDDGFVVYKLEWAMA